MEPPIKDTPIKDTIDITSEQRTRFNVPNGDFPILLTSDKGQPLNIGQNDQKTMGPKRVRYSKVPLYCTAADLLGWVHCMQLIDRLESLWVS